MNENLKRLAPRKDKMKMIRAHPDFNRVLKKIFPDVPMSRITKRIADKLKEEFRV